MILRDRRKNKVEEQAAAWAARLSDAHDGTDRQEFEAWIESDPAHRLAYDRAVSAFQASGVLRSSALGRARNLEAAFHKRGNPVRRALLTASVAGLLIVGAYELTGGLQITQPLPIVSVMLASGADGRDVRLADGSTVKMAPATEVKIDLKRKERVAELRRGQMRLSVARERRPFIILAGDRRIEAREGTFEARLRGGASSITPAAPASTPSVLQTSSPDTVQQHPPGRQVSLEFRAEPLRDAVARINQALAGPPIEIDPTLANLRVTGIFQRGDTTAVASSLALAFDLHLSSTAAGTLRLSRK